MGIDTFFPGMIAGLPEADLTVDEDTGPADQSPDYAEIIEPLRTLYIDSSLNSECSDYAPESRSCA